MDFSHKVLFVDDEPNILNALKRLFRKEQFLTFFAGSGAEGLSILEKENITLVVSDHRMPEMTGTEFLQRVKKHFPNPLRVILSGYADANVIIDSINKGEIYRFFSKPWDDNDLRVRIRQCLEHYDFLNEINRLTIETNQQNLELENLNQNLEEIIAKKSASLKFFQSLYYKLPVPAIGISQEGLLVLINRAFENNPFYKITGMGAPIEESFPEKYVTFIRECLKGTQSLMHYYDPVTKYKSTIKSIFINGITAGCLVIIEEYTP